jgi:CTP synthase
MKYIFVTGGVVSSLGKGIAASSIGYLLELRGVKLTLLKFDPYINVDPGTLSPYQHGEVYVTEDGAETDLDLGHYERFTTARMGCENNVTAGKIYYSVIMKERHGDYLGETVQVVPHITDEIKNSIHRIADESKYSVIITEVGGTVGDIEGLPFLEAIRQFRNDVGRENVVHVHLTLVPYISVSEELKTKPTQHSVMKLREIGIHPDIILCRAKEPLSRELKEKIALFCDIPPEAVISAYDVGCVYEVPVVFEQEGLDDVIMRLLRLTNSETLECIDRRNRWMEALRKIKSPSLTTTVAVVGKYIKLRDAYKSIIEALTHGGIANDSKVKIKWVDAETVESEGFSESLGDVDGILVPGGFGERGILGKVEVARYAREKEVPFFGICLGLQCAVIEIAKNVAGLHGANSSEFDPTTPHPVIDLLPEQREVKDKGGTMRLGAYPCKLNNHTLSYRAYEKELIFERHRHRYEFNPRYRTILERAGLEFAGTSPEGKLVEIIELRNHPWFVGTQFHPEFKSKPLEPHPLFKDFIAAALMRGRK